MKLVRKIRNSLMNSLAFLVVGGVCLLCALFIIIGTKSDAGFITLDGKDATIEEYTKKFIENSNDALYRIMNEDAPTDEATIKEYEDAEGLGGSTTLEAVKNRRLPDGDTDNGKGWQCSKYTAYLATDRREYSSTHPDYGPVNGKNVAQWLHDNFGWKYTDELVEGAIGSGGFNTLYGHTAEFLYWTGENTAMVSDANYVPLTVSTHNMNVSGWVWVVPGDYEPNPEPEPTPEPTPEPISECSIWYVKWGDTMSNIMKRCEGQINWAEMNAYANRWISRNTGRSVFYGWTHGTGYGLIAGDVIDYQNN